MSAALFPPGFIAEVLARTPLAALVGRSVNLTRAGKYWRGKCPIHQGRGQSFSVWDTGYRCFSCGAKGDAIRWTMHEGVGFIGAVKQLAADAGMALPDGIGHDDPAEVARQARERADRLAAYQKKQAAEEAATRAAAIADARAIWSQCIPIEDTLGDHYLTGLRGLPRPATGWPTCLGYHAARKMLVAALTAPDGTVQAVHRIYLKADGTNRRDADGEKRKLSLGPMDGAAIRLSGTGDTLHAEGLETGMSAWISTGNPTMIYAGAVADRLIPQPGRNIILADDDAPGSPADKKLVAAMERWTEAGIDFVVAQPWEAPRHDKSDFNDVLRQGGIEAVRERITASSNSISTDFVIAPPHNDNGGAGGAAQEPPEGWQDARPVLGEQILLPPLKPGLPAHYPAPTEDTATAKARLDAAMLDHMVEGMRLHRLQREIRRRRDEEVAFVNDKLGIDEELSPGEKGAIKARIHRDVAEREGYGTKLPEPPIHQFTSTPGSGKTTVARQFAAISPGEVTWITETTFEKLEEEYAAYLMEPDPKPPAMLVRGRARPDPQRPGHYMCERPDAARMIAEANLSVPKLLCSGCEFSKVCGDHRQRREADALVAKGDGAVFFLAGAYVFLSAPVPKPNHAILDESLLQLATDVRSVPIDKLAKITVPNIFGTKSSDTGVILRAIIDAFTLPHPTTPERVAAGDEQIMPRALAYLRHARIDKAALKYLTKAVDKEIDRQTPQLGAHMSDSEIEHALEGGDRGMLRQLLVLIAAIKREIDIPRETATGVWLDHRSRKAAIGIARLRKLKGLKRAFLTVLDGTGKVHLSRKLFGDRLVETNIRFERLAYVIGTKGKSYSKVSITAEDREGNIIRGREAPAARLRGEIATIYDRLPAGSSVFGPKRVEEILLDSGALHRDTPTMHFGDLRGKNSRKNDPGALFVGAENIGIADIEATARAFMADDPVPFVSMDHTPLPTDNWKRWKNQWHYWATRMRRMRDGTLAPVEVPVHPDPRVQDVLEITREDELIQAVDRLRSIWNRRQFTLLNNLCLDLTYDEILIHPHMVKGGNPVMRALLATGIVPHTPELLHRAHPTIFRSPKAAEHALARYPQNPGGSLLWDLGVSSFRRAGQTGRDAKVTVDRTRWPDNAALIAAIEAFSGPLASFEGVPLHPGATPDNATVTPMGGGWVPPEPSQPGRGAAPPSVWVHGPPDD